MSYLQILWVWFWVEKMGRCPRCFRTFWVFSDLGVEFDYCPNHPQEAYYTDGTKVDEE